ncbi:DsbA family protein [Streptosporangium sp. KLBMP 9127]|nr:DsbA family protein [Streptosporangium sp. KLBMP 9127]
MPGEKMVDFWFDPMCPYTWITSQWMREVERVRPVEVRWHIMSLSVLNEHRDDDPENDPEGFLWFPVRVCVAAEQQYGAQALARLYTAIGARVIEQGRMDGLMVALADAGLPAELIEAGHTTEYDDALRASHAAGIGLVGEHVGTPVIATDGADGGRIAFFGPVVSRIPRGEEAGRLWDGSLLVAGVRGFHELKGRPHAEPDFHG